MHLGLDQTRSGHEQWRMQRTKEKENEKGKSRLPCAAVMSGWRWKQRRPVVNWGSCSSLFSCNMNSEEWINSLSTVHFAEHWRMQKTKEKEKEKEKGKSRLPCATTMSGWRWKQRRPVVKGSCSPLMDDDPSFFLLFLLFSFSLYCVPLSTVCNTNWSCFLLTCSSNANNNRFHK